MRIASSESLQGGGHGGKPRVGGGPKSLKEPLSVFSLLGSELSRLWSSWQPEPMPTAWTTGTKQPRAKHSWHFEKAEKTETTAFGVGQMAKGIPFMWRA